MEEKLYSSLSPNEQDRYFVDYQHSAVIVRGNILNAVTSLEMSIDLYITNYFTEDVDKSEELMNLIISPRMSLENKIQVLMVLFERHNPSVLDEHKTIRKDLVDNIIPERNVLAHYPLDVTPWALQSFYEDGSLTFFKFKNVTESIDGKKGMTKLTNSIVYNVQKTADLVKLINKYHLAITLSLETAPPPKAE